jgi:hypothetical protein
VAFASWTSPYVGYVNIPGWPFDSPDTRYARSLHILPLGFPSGHNPSIG